MNRNINRETKVFLKGPATDVVFDEFKDDVLLMSDMEKFYIDIGVKGYICLNCNGMTHVSNYRTPKKIECCHCHTKIHTRSGGWT